MSIPVKVDGLGDGITFQPAGAFSGPKLLVNGNPAPKGDKRMTFMVPDASGAQAQVKLHPSFTGAALEFQGSKTKLGPDIATWLLVIAGLPLALIGVGGLIGGACGGGAFAVNLGIARGDTNVGLKVVLMLVSGAAAAMVYFVVASMIQGALS